MSDWIVVKLGGSLLDGRAQRSRAIAGIRSALSEERQLVIVHGGGKRIDSELQRLGIEKRTKEHPQDREYEIQQEKYQHTHDSD